ncbi:MAG: hypothetical protein IK129_05230 [Deltaproteobacteria bacterium]|nr:hypothetical protein [Deltaproteobacteria bacterium]
MRRTTLFLSLVLMGILTASGCHRTAPINNPTFVISVSKKLTQTQVREAIYTACPQRGWTARDISSNTIEATLRVRGKHTVVVDIIYSSSDYTIRYKSSDNMRTGGDGTIHPNYNRWVNNLSHDIDIELARIASR